MPKKSVGSCRKRREGVENLSGELSAPFVSCSLRLYSKGLGRKKSAFSAVEKALLLCIFAKYKKTATEFGDCFFDDHFISMVLPRAKE